MNLSDELTQVESFRSEARFQEAEKLLVSLLEQFPNDVRIHHLLGLTSLQLQNPDRARECFERVLDIAPDHAEACKGLGDAYTAQNEYERAKSSYLKAIEFNPDFYQAHANLANLFSINSESAEAIQHYKEAIRVKPDIAELHDSLGRVLASAGRSNLASFAYRHALELNPQLATAHHGMGSILETGGHLNDAIKHYRRAIAIAPELQISQLGLVSTLIESGKTEEAKQILAPFSRKFGNNRLVQLLEARLAIAEKRYEDARDILLNAEKVALNTGTGVREIDLQLAGLADQTGQFREAFRYYDKVHDDNESSYDREKELQKIEDLFALYPGERAGKFPESGNQTSIPVFVLGMSRSGKTLAQQLLCSHRQIVGLDEMNSISDLFYSLGSENIEKSYSEMLSGVSAVDLDRLSQDYLDMSEEYLEDVGRSFDDGCKHVVSAIPGNVRNLGFIRQVFPNAPIIHVKRHPLDNCLECFFKEYSSKVHAYSNDLEDLGFFYQQHLKIMSHWRDTLGIPMLEIYYEDLVRDPLGTRKILYEYIGFNTDKGDPGFKVNMEEFNFSTDRIGRWKNYEEEIQPLIRVLGDSAG